MEASLDAQVAAVLRRYPQFRVVVDVEWAVFLEGTIRPLGKTYRIQCLFVARGALSDVALNHFAPRVWVVEPALELLHHRTEGRFPMSIGATAGSLNPTSASTIRP